MADFGLTDAGFTLKRLADIKTDVEADLKATFGEIDTDPDSVFGQLIGVFCEALSEVWEQAENIYNSMYPSSAEGTALDNAADFTGAVRLAASRSTAVVQALGDDTTVIPVDTVFSQLIAKETFQSTVEATIGTANLHKTKITVAEATALFTYEITIDAITVSYVAGATTSAAAIAAGLMAAINANATLAAKVLAAYTAGDAFFTVTILLPTLANVFEAAVGTAKLELTELWSPVAVESVNLGRIAVPLGSINVIDTPVLGLDEVTNLAEGTTGRATETDGEFRIRRRRSLGIVASSTLEAITARILQDIPEVTAAFIFENDTDEFVGLRPPHSFETVVAAADTALINQAIADKIWERKPAGIKPYGTTVMTVVDSNGTNQSVGFTHSATQYVFLELSYSRSGSDSVFPVGGEATIAQALLDIGNALSFGSDLLIQKFAAAGYVVDGVTDVTMRMAISADPEEPSPSWQTTNISIATADFPSFDLSRITVQETV